MPKRTANYRGYAIEGSRNGRGWFVEVHPRGPDFPILNQGSFRAVHSSWNSALAEAYSRVDAVLGDQHDSEPSLPKSLEQALEGAWQIVGVTDRVIKSGPNAQTQLRRDLLRCIMTLAARGVTDPNELRRKAVERIVLGEGAGASSGSSLIKH